VKIIKINKKTYEIHLVVMSVVFAMFSLFFSLMLSFIAVGSRGLDDSVIPGSPRISVDDLWIIGILPYIAYVIKSIYENKQIDKLIGTTCTKQFGNSLLSKLKKYKTDFKTITTSKGANLASYEFSKEIRGKGGHLYDSCILYSLVGRAQLIKPVPHIFFDSKTSDKKWRYFFNSKQRYSFEGNFDKFYTSYLVDGHQINSLSFITPEVMEVLITNKSFDYEIVGNEIFAYGALGSVATRISLIESINAVTYSINDNLTHYNESLPPSGSVGKIRLVKNPISYIKWYLYSLVLVLIAVYSFTTTDKPNGRLKIIFGFSLWIFACIMTARSEKKNNKW
jgi:hypothetical protein